MSSRKDLAAQPLSACLWWGLPIAIGAAATLLHLPLRVAAGLCSVLFLWMATGCFLNARRCHRVHCYISEPILLLGAFFGASVALGIVAVSGRTFANTVSVVLVLALLSFVPELVWKRYV